MPPHTSGTPLHQDYKSENVALLSAGCVNLVRHITNARMYGIPVVVAVNKFASDTEVRAVGGWWLDVDVRVVGGWMWR